MTKGQIIKYVKEIRLLMPYKDIELRFEELHPAKFKEPWNGLAHYINLSLQQKESFSLHNKKGDLWIYAHDEDPERNYIKIEFTHPNGYQFQIRTPYFKGL